MIVTKNNTMKINSKVGSKAGVFTLAQHTAKIVSKGKAKTAIVAKVAAVATKAKKTKIAAVTGNFWKKLRELGSYAHGVKLYCLRGSDYNSQALVDWHGVKGADKRLVLFVKGKRGCAMLNVHAKGSIIRVSADKGIELASFKSALLLSANDAVKLVQKQGKAQAAFNYNGKSHKGHLLEHNGEFYSVFTNGRDLFEGEASRISGKNEEQAKHVWSLGGK